MGATPAERAFEEDKRRSIEQLGRDHRLREMSLRWTTEVSVHRYSYNFTWAGRPIIQFPQDIVAMQEIIWSVQPDLIVETGVAHGGGTVFYASMLELLKGDGEVVGIDVEIRRHNRLAIEHHPLACRIRLMEGSSTDEAVVASVRELARGKRSVLVALDSNHTHAHVRRELELYAPLVTRGSYLVVFDTIIEDIEEIAEGFFTGRPWAKGNNPKSAVRAFLEENDRFVVDEDIQSKLLITVASGGYLKCVKD